MEAGGSGFGLAVMSLSVVVIAASLPEHTAQRVGPKTLLDPQSLRWSKTRGASNWAGVTHAPEVAAARLCASVKLV